MDTIEREARVLTGPWIFYDGTCRICRSGEKRFGPMMRRRGLRLATLQSAIGRELASGGVDEMRVLTRSGGVIGGAEGIAYLCGYVWWAKPVGWLWRMAWGRRIMRRAYIWVAAHRHCAAGVCEVEHRAKGVLP